MATFPQNRDEQLVLAQQIIDGVTANTTEYPSATFNVASLTAALGAVRSSTTDRQTQEALLVALVEQEREAYTTMTEMMRAILIQAEQRHQNAPENLPLIGWAGKATSHTRVPHQPRTLEAFSRGAGSVFLDWKAPQENVGAGRVRFYRVDRQVRTLTGTTTEAWGTWSQTVIESEALLTGQPRGVELEYRIVAINATGESIASNTVTVTL